MWRILIITIIACQLLRKEYIFISLFHINYFVVTNAECLLEIKCKYLSVLNLLVLDIIRLVKLDVNSKIILPHLQINNVSIFW